MPIFTPTPENLAAAAQLIRDGGLVAFPTETVYGLGADAYHPRACAAIFEAKGRPSFDPLIVHLAGLYALDGVVTEVPEAALRLAGRFWPGPLTMVLRKRLDLPGIVTAGLSTVAVRVPAHPVAQELLRLADCPLAAPSANPFGQLSPTTAAHVEAQLGAKAAMILDGGPCAVGVESAIVDLSGDTPRLLRDGGVPLEELEQALGAKLERGPAVMAKPLAPGQLASHYAPRLPLRLAAKTAAEPGDAYLAFSRPPSGSFVALEVLSDRRDLREAAANLFAALHRLDLSGAKRIVAELAPEEGLGRAINERLRKASS